MRREEVMSDAKKQRVSVEQTLVNPDNFIPQVKFGGRLGVLARSKDIKVIREPSNTPAVRVLTQEEQDNVNRK